MTPRRYTGAHARDCLRRAKEDLGDDAIVLASRCLGDGVELLALPRGGVCSAPTAGSDPRQSLLRQLDEIKILLQRQLAGCAWTEMGRRAPVRQQLLTELIECGFSADLVLELVRDVPAAMTPARARAAVRARLGAALATAPDDRAIIDAGGVYALVGPTGVGKSTTAAKLAARAVLRYGAGRVALVTTDGYRIGAYEQLRIYGRILGVPVYQARDAAQLRATLAHLRDRHLVLIDTAGMSHRDRRLGDQRMLLDGAPDVRRLLLLNAASRVDTLQEVAVAYGGQALAGCIVTKLDEAVSLAPALDVAVRRRMAVLYLANGQRVPEDLHVPNRAYLLHRVFKRPPEESAQRLGTDGAGLVLAGGAPILTRAA
jgi:flagellar biosynthesis protein FlhF